MSEINPELEEFVMHKVEAWKRQLRLRCLNAGFSVESDIVIHLIFDENIYVLANPVVHSIPLYNESGRLTGEFVPRRNFQAKWQPYIKGSNGDVVMNPEPYSMEPILAPWLAVKLDTNGELIADGAELERMPKDLSVDIVNEINGVTDYPGLFGLL